MKRWERFVSWLARPFLEQTQARFARDPLLFVEPFRTTLSRASIFVADVEHAPAWWQEYCVKKKFAEREIVAPSVHTWFTRFMSSLPFQGVFIVLSHFLSSVSWTEGMLIQALIWLSVDITFIANRQYHALFLWYWRGKHWAPKTYVPEEERVIANIRHTFTTEELLHLRERRQRIEYTRTTFRDAADASHHRSLDFTRVLSKTKNRAFLEITRASFKQEVALGKAMQEGKERYDVAMETIDEAKQHLNTLLDQWFAFLQSIPRETDPQLEHVFTYHAADIQRSLIEAYRGLEKALYDAETLDAINQEASFSSQADEEEFVPEEEVARPRKQRCIKGT